MLKLNKKTYIVAEIGNNHEGNFILAKKMIKKAAQSGVDAVKFQTFITEKYVSSHNIKRIKQLKKFKLTIEEFKLLSNYAKKLKVVFFSTPLDLTSAKQLNSFQKIFKISSGDNNFYELIELIATFGKPIIISCGFADIILINKVYKKIKKIWKKNRINSKIIFMHCVSSYPVKLNDANLGAITSLKKKFKDCIIGYSDHTLGIEAAKYAAVLGASVIEKHFTLNKNYSKFRDHKISANPFEMRELVKCVRNIPNIIGDGKVKLESCEKKNIKNSRRSIIANKEILKGGRIKKIDLSWVRPQKGLKPGDENKIIGKIAAKLIKKGELIKIKNVKKS